MLAIDIVDLLAPDPPDVVSPEEDRLRREAEEAAARAAAEAARATAPPPALPLNLRIAESEDYARIVFDCVDGATAPAATAPRSAPARRLAIPARASLTRAR